MTPMLKSESPLGYPDIREHGTGIAGLQDIPDENPLNSRSPDTLT
jgi:hypothetical protein